MITIKTTTTFCFCASGLLLKSNSSTGSALKMKSLEDAAEGFVRQNAFYYPSNSINN